jgi:cytochrome c-type biogenesis protein
VIDAPLALAFTAGMIATVNPCGFAMLPAYLSFFVGVDRQDTGGEAAVSVARGLLVGLAVTLGFALTFATIGLVVVHLTSAVYDIGPWITVVIGGALLVLGVALLVGWEPNVRLPKLERGGRTRGLVSMVLFGVSYAVASLGCTLPLFLVQMAGIFRGTNTASGIAFFLAYAAGMGVVLTSLTMALALADRSLVGGLRRLVPYVNRIAGALLILSGAYVAYYGVYEIRFGSGATESDSIVARVTGWSSDVSNWVQDVGATRIGLTLAAFIGLTVAYGTTRRSRRRARAAADDREVEVPG